MTQHLGHVRDYLAGSAHHLDGSGGAPDHAWEALHRRLSGRLLSDTHRIYLGRTFSRSTDSASVAPSREERGASSPGDIDLF